MDYNINIENYSSGTFSYSSGYSTYYDSKSISSEQETQNEIKENEMKQEVAPKRKVGRPRKTESKYLQYLKNKRERSASEAKSESLSSPKVNRIKDKDIKVLFKSSAQDDNDFNIIQQMKQSEMAQICNDITDIEVEEFIEDNKVTFNDEDIEEDELLMAETEEVPNYPGNDGFIMQLVKKKPLEPDDYLKKEDQCDFSIFNDPAKFARTIDLAQAGVIECIDAYITFRYKSKNTESFEHLKKHLKYLQDKFNMKIFPIVVCDLFWRQFHKYLRKERKLMPNTIIGLCSRLVAVLKWSVNYGVRLSPSFDHYQLDYMYEKPTVFLTPDDISRITYFDIDSLKIDTKKKNSLKRCRDMFVLSCYLGQRYSDMIRVSPENFKNNKFVMIQQKTGRKCVNDLNVVPQFPQVVEDILKRYDYKSPYPTTNSIYNRRLHELFRLAGFNKEIVFEYKEDGEIHRKVYKQWELITSHTGRRSMITNAVQRGIRTDIIRRASGHHSEKSFNKYIIYNDD